MVGITGAAVATPLSEVTEKFTSNFASNFATSGPTRYDQRLDLGPTPKPGEVKLIEDSEIFSNWKLVPDTLSEIPRDEPIPSIEELITVASLTPANFDPSDATIRTDSQGPAYSRNSGATVRDMVRNLINRSQLPASGKARERIKDGGGLGFSLLNTVLETQLDMDFVDTVAGIINPSIGLNGVVTLNIFGLREIAFFMSPVTNEIRVMDFKSMKYFTVNQTTNQELTSLQNPNRRNQKRSFITPNYDRMFSIYKFLKAARIFVTDYLLHPLTLGMVFILSVLLSFCRMGQEA